MYYMIVMGDGVAVAGDIRKAISLLGMAFSFFYGGSSPV
jgi:hypothetical protein